MDIFSIHQNRHISQLYVANHRWLSAWLLKKLQCPHRSADIVQDTFERLLRREYLVRQGEPRAMLTTIAKGLMVDFARRQSLEITYFSALARLPESEIPSAESQAIVLQTLLEVSQMLDSLPAKVKQVFFMSQIDGMTYPQIAKSLHISVSTVQKYMAKAYALCYKVRYQD